MSKVLAPPLPACPNGMLGPTWRVKGPVGTFGPRCKGGACFGAFHIASTRQTNMGTSQSTPPRRSHSTKARMERFERLNTLVDTWRLGCRNEPQGPACGQQRLARMRNGPKARALGPDAVFHANRGVAGMMDAPPPPWSAAATGKSTWLVTGDVAFHYDANALLTDPMPPELRIVVMNNGGGGIFRWLPGTQHPDLFERHFETPPNRTVKGNRPRVQPTSSPQTKPSCARHFPTCSAHQVPPC